jgi:acyl carrier protein
MDEEIYAKMTKIFRGALSDDAIEVTPDLTAGDVPEWDSPGHIRLVLAER